MTDPEMRAAIELQIKEFGQTPKQLFRKPHPKRRIRNKSPESNNRTESESNLADGVAFSLSDSLSSTSDWVFVQPNEGMRVWV